MKSSKERAGKRDCLATDNNNHNRNKQAAENDLPRAERRWKLVGKTSSSLRKRCNGKGKRETESKYKKEENKEIKDRKN